MIVLLDAEAKELRLAAAAADDRAELLAREKAQVMGLAEELRADVAAKMTLLDEFEARFARQYRCVVSSLDACTSPAIRPNRQCRPLPLYARAHVNLCYVCSLFQATLQLAPYVHVCMGRW